MDKQNSEQVQNSKLDKNIITEAKIKKTGSLFVFCWNDYNHFQKNFSSKYYDLDLTNLDNECSYNSNVLFTH